MLTCLSRRALCRPARVGTMYEFTLILLLLRQMCVYLVIAYLLSKTPLFIPLMHVTVRLPHKMLCYVMIFHVLHHGHLFWFAHPRILSPIPAQSALFWAGWWDSTSGLHRYSMGGMTAFSCMISTIVEGLLGAGASAAYLLRPAGLVVSSAHRRRSDAAGRGAADGHYSAAGTSVGC